MDEIAEFNRERWNELSEAGVCFSRPWLDLTEEKARDAINREGINLKIKGEQVLCLAASGDQQSAAFGLLGAHVTVFDLSESQLEKDARTADVYGCPVKTVRGDMRDLSIFPKDSFDIVWLAHGINFVPDARLVIEGAARVLKPGGFFRIEITNPYAHGVWDKWTGKGCLVTDPFIDGGEVLQEDPYWDVESEDGIQKRIHGPREFRHSLSTIVNTLIANSLRILGLWEAGGGDPCAEPGSWKHFKSRIPPWITLWAISEKRS